MKKQGYKQGTIVILVICIALIFIAISSLAASAAYMGDRTGAMYGGKIIDKPGAAGPAGPTGTPTGMGCGSVPLFLQGDPQWGGDPYGSCSGLSTIKSSGCGITSAAMVLAGFGKSVDPKMMADTSAANGYRVCGAGTSYGFFPFIAKQYGLRDENGIGWSRAMELLKNGTPVIAAGQGSAPFTGGGHFIVMTCYNSDGTISVNDPARGIASYTEDIISSQQHFLTAIYP